MPYDGADDVVLQTRKRNGMWVATPVNPLVEADHVFFRTSGYVGQGEAVAQLLGGALRAIDSQWTSDRPLVTQGRAALSSTVMTPPMRRRSSTATTRSSKGSAFGCTTGYGVATLHYRIDDITQDEDWSSGK